MEIGENQEQKENEINNQNQAEEGMIEQEEDNLDEAEDNKLMYIYEWVDSIPLSRQKKNISRDFNDAVLFAEMIKYHYPRLVDLHNYPSASSTKAKMINWETLNKKVLEKIGLKLNKSEIDDLVRSKPNAIENLLGRLYNIIHGKPQMNNISNKKHHLNNMNNNVIRNNNMMMNNEETAELINAINEKDQEISKLQDYIKTLEQKIENSKENQKQLELKIKELNAI
jgi:HD superfamily phosphohydrolase